MTLYDVVKKLIGEVKPIGETRTDDIRFENLKQLTELVDKLETDIDEIAMLKDRPEYSIKRAGEFADAFLTKLGISN